MKHFNKLSLLNWLLVSFFVLFINVVPSLAATTVNLGTGENFAVLGASTVTNTGSSVITGNLGVSPGTAITGFPPGLVNDGTIHAADAVALQAQSDLTTAYNNAAGQSCDTDLTGQDLGGLTLTPGVYCFESSAQLTGTLTLNGQGNPDSVFIFKMGSTITTASGSSVAFINSAQACYVFWQVGSSATLGTNTNFRGNILALTSITLNTGASVDGRVLARNGAVTLDNNTVAKSTCTLTTPTPTSIPETTSTPTPTTTPLPTSTSTSSPSDSNSNGVPYVYCSPISSLIVTPVIIESKRIDADSIFIV